MQFDSTRDVYEYIADELERYNIHTQFYLDPLDVFGSNPDGSWRSWLLLFHVEAVGFNLHVLHNLIGDIIDDVCQHSPFNEEGFKVFHSVVPHHFTIEILLS